MPFDDIHFEIVRREVSRHLEDTETSKLAHWHSADVYGSRNRWMIGVPATILSIALTWMLAADTKVIFSFEKAPVFLSLIVSMLTGVGAFLNLSDLAVRHRTTAENLSGLWRDCKNWDTEYPDASLCEKAVQTALIYRRRLNEINKDAPPIPKWAWKSVNRQRAEGSVSYKIDNSQSH
ncbi:SLATT domain-containing protein [Tardiphaga sp.]|uniref:SLATT domain-containing protein n=1 Tax=Tardiphaga sp. TaxID=1926292 RepID=UPI00262A90D5|nr:SLATT domain-containing protein [Tardiphaga sp.]